MPEPKTPDAKSSRADVGAWIVCAPGTDEYAALSRALDPKGTDPVSEAAFATLRYRYPRKVANNPWNWAAAAGLPFIALGVVAAPGSAPPGWGSWALAAGLLFVDLAAWWVVLAPRCTHWWIAVEPTRLRMAKVSFGVWKRRTIDRDAITDIELASTPFGGGDVRLHSVRLRLADGVTAEIQLDNLDVASHGALMAVLNAWRFGIPGNQSSNDTTMPAGNTQAGGEITHADPSEANGIGTKGE